MVMRIRLKPGETLEVDGVMLRNMGEGSARLGLVTRARRIARYDVGGSLVYETIDGEESRDERK